MQNYKGQNNASTRSTPTFKVVLLGEAGVGKSAIFMRIKDNVFSERLEPTIGIESCSKCVSVDGDKVMIWDTAGAERYRTLTRNYYRNTHALLLVYSVDNPASLLYLTKWLEEAADAAPHAMAFLVGNKSDLERSVPDENVVDFAEAHGLDGVFDTSAKTGEGLVQALRNVGQTLVNRFKSPTTSESIFDDSIRGHTRKRNPDDGICACRI